MAKESDFQSRVLKYLRSKGAWCMKVQAGPGVPNGTADIFFCKEGFYGFLECKANATAKRQPGQAEFIRRMDEWSFAKIIYPKNWPEVKELLEKLL